jgi:hypothetical protein
MAAIPEERRAIILAGEAAIVNRRRALDDWIALGRAYYELQAEAMRQSKSSKPRGRRYKATYALLQRSPEIINLQKIDKADRKKAIWLYQNKDLVRHWYETLSESQRGRLAHPQTIKQHYERVTHAARPDNTVDGNPIAKPALTLALLKAANVQLREQLDTAIANIRLLERAKREMERAKGKMLPITRKDAPAQILDVLEAEVPGMRTTLVELELNRLKSTTRPLQKPVLRLLADREIGLGRGSKHSRSRRRTRITVGVEHRKLELRRTGLPSDGASGSADK